ncbi:YceI family protein [Actinophytocola oryzae]|uniref:Polyisoprenoid-binding protein YceI n=1 Tax=Actinophytocola oryzae TaxID=502181 RepID=A0A4R7VRD9_9PSEU|nr:YceI family protein [Actinophytocola oryzae]TDV51929.1 polyisoprenoid-binding protein YceI [Actinophytocola oryzae]
MSTTTATIEAPTRGAYRIEPGESSVEFATRHMFGLAPVRGTFPLREGVVHVAEPVETSLVRAVVDATGFDTGLPARDDTVRSEKFLDTAHHPDITFVANGVSGDDLVGTLTVRGRTEPLTVHIDEVRVLDNRLQLRATAEVDRYAWGVTAMKGMTGRRLRFTLALVATRVD